MYRAYLVLIYAVDLALFVLVFLVVRSRRLRPESRLALIAGSVTAYLVSLVLLIYVSSRL